MRWHKKARPLPWRGGKSTYGKSDWIYSLLPWEKKTTYVEPFGGMAGVLLRRAPVENEIFNDLDNRIVNWWNVLRTQPKEFGWQVQCTPYSKQVHKQAIDLVDDPTKSDMERAVAFHVLALQSASHRLSGKPSWKLTLLNKNHLGRWRCERVAVLAERFWNVQLDRCPAEKLLTRLSDLEYAVIYCDPPYPSFENQPYHVSELDVSKLSGLLLSQRGRVAISGRGSEWDHLGWHKHTCVMASRPSSWIKGAKGSEITEVLWTNYDAADVANMGGGLFADLG